MSAIFELRPSTDADLELIVELRRAAFRDPARQTFGEWDEPAATARFRERFVAQRHRVIVADGQPVGVLELEHEGSSMRVRTLIVDETVRSREIGTSVMRCVLSEHDDVVLRVLKVNTRAKRFYQRLGFQTVGESDEHWWELRSVQPARGSSAPSRET